MKKVSLCLGGGSAIGFIHVGVLKYLEEKNVSISEISGTSMGAIIGAMIAIGKSSKYMIELANNLNFFSLIDVDLSTGLLKGKKIEEKLFSIFGDKKIEDCKIPLKIVATNINSSEFFVFESGSIVDAIRASISLPGIFIPKEINSNSYIDGGMMMNLPIEILNGKNIIAVSALKINTGNIIKEKKIFGINFKSGFWENNYEIIKRAVFAMMKVNEDNSLKTIGKNIILIRPDFGDLDIMDFNKIYHFVEIGYKEAIKMKI